jgi:hypothetical protein
MRFRSPFAISDRRLSLIFDIETNFENNEKAHLKAVQALECEA